MNKVLGHYTTNQGYRSVASNHLNNVHYDENSLCLWITFYNGAKYKYFGVPKDLYLGMMKSPSHGVFFWENIRQKFPYKLVEQGSKQEPVTDILSKLSRGHKKLNEIDEFEKQAELQLKKGLISSDKFEEIQELASAQRDKAIQTIDKEKGVYKSLAQIRREEKEQEKLVALQQLIDEEKQHVKILRLKKGLMLCLITGSVIFTINHILVGGIITAFLVDQYQKIR